MTNKTKQILFSSILMFFLFLSWQVFAQGNLEIEYPTIPGADTPQDINTPLPTYLKYFYNFSIFLAGILSFVLLVWAGVRYVVSAGKPAKMTDAKEQIGAALLGLIVVFTSYLILNTISPDLVLLPPSLVQEILPVSVPPVNIVDDFSLDFQEIPLGTMITSEIGPSIFVSTSTVSVATSTDPDTSLPEYASNSSNVISYVTVYEQSGFATSTNYQGALEGRRLKRIHEVASTTMPVADMLGFLYEELVGIIEEMQDQIDQLYQYSRECNCSHCNPGDCKVNKYSCNCSLCNNFSGDFCPSRIDMIKLENSIPEFYKDNDSRIPCKIAELEYLAHAYNAFLNAPKQLVKSNNPDYENKSYWHSDEAIELRGQIDSCITADNIEQSQYDDTNDETDKPSIEELIDLMANVENKGTHSPKTDPSERDVQTNIRDLEEKLQFLLNIKYVLNPHYNPQPITRIQFFADIKTRLESSFENTKINIFSITQKNLRAVDDPATFYRPPEAIMKTPSNIVFAQEPVTCAIIVEIPIGKALDEAIKLVQDILREIKNVRSQGLRIIKKIDRIAKDDDGEAQKLFDTIDDFIDLVKEIKQCPDMCSSECPVGLPTYFDCDPDPFTGAYKTCCHCSCIPAQSIDKTNALMKNIGQTYLDIKNLENTIKLHSATIKWAKTNIYESFFKLNSKYPEEYIKNGEMMPHPNAGEDVYIGKDICCTNEEGDCRDDNGNLVETEERDYTLIKKLIWVQKLLNRSRNFEDFKYLIKKLGSPLAKEEEIDNVLLQQKIDYTTIGGPLDLTNCTMLYADILKYTKGNESLKMLENCQMAKYYGQIQLEECNPSDPPLDCDYFDSATTTKKTPLNCYCYEEVWYPNYPDITSNFFCCVTRKLEIND